jgi:hypothetical protein
MNEFMIFQFPDSLPKKSTTKDEEHPEKDDNFIATSNLDAKSKMPKLYSLANVDEGLVKLYAISQEKSSFWWVMQCTILNAESLQNFSKMWSSLTLELISDQPIFTTWDRLRQNTYVHRIGNICLKKYQNNKLKQNVILRKSLLLYSSKILSMNFYLLSTAKRRNFLTRYFLRQSSS